MNYIAGIAAIILMALLLLAIFAGFVMFNYALVSTALAFWGCSMNKMLLMILCIVGTPLVFIRRG